MHDYNRAFVLYKLVDPHSHNFLEENNANIVIRLEYNETAKATAICQQKNKKYITSEVHIIDITSVDDLLT